MRKPELEAETVAEGASPVQSPRLAVAVPEPIEPRDERPDAAPAGAPTLESASEGVEFGTLFVRGERYRLGELLGEGGMGSVRLLEDRRVGRQVALKRMRNTESPGGNLWVRFLREARVQGQLEHPSIAPLYDLDVSADGDPYFTMRRVQGETLADVLFRLREGDEATRARWSQRKLLTDFASVCLAVHYAHTKGVLHRDLKPSNIMLGAFGEVYVLDWGLARLLDAEPGPASAGGAEAEAPSSVDTRILTQDGAVLGTPLYMAPEQFLGGPDPDARLDVYALGLVLYEIFALRPLHSGRAFREIASLTLTGIDARPSLVAPETPPEIDALCARATAVDPKDRLASALELAESVERFLDGVRDTEQRRELALKGASSARDTLERADRETDDNAREQGRSAAMREVVGALALDSEQPLARTLMVQLLTDVPRTPPPAVRREIAEAQDAARQRGLKLARWIWVTWLLTIPAVYLLGVRSVPAFLAECGLAALGTALCFDMARRPHVRRGQTLAMALVTALMVSGLAMWLGPFVLVPSVASALLILISAHSRPTERRPLIAIGALVVLAPVLLEWAGILPPSYSFDGDRMCLLARAMDVTPTPTLTMLVWSTIGFVLVPAVMLARLRDQLDAAQARLALQSWQLRQLGGGG